jgi:CRP-like cAMP-binding protein
MLDLETIRALEMFEGLKEHEFGKIFRLAKQTDYAAGAVIVREGAPGGMLHVVMEGQVEVRKHASSGDEKPLAVLSQGAVFGEMSLFDGYPYSASVLATQPTKTMSLFHNDFMTLAESEPGLAFKVTVNLLNIVSRKLRKTNENLVTLAMLREAR